MKYRRAVSAAVAAIAVALIGGTLAAGSAGAAAPDPTGSALARVNQGSYTAADVAVIRRDPALAAQVPDPAGVTTGVSKGRTAVPVTARAAKTLGSCGWWVDVWYKQKSLLGSTIYIWHHKVVYCKTTKKITKWQNRYDYLTHEQSIVAVRKLTVNQKSAVGAYSAWSHLQRHLEYCVVKYGCYANTYPWAKITIKANGTYTYKGAAH